MKAVFGEYRRRSVLGFTLMMSQAFFYNAIFFTYALVLSNFYGVAASSIGYYLLPFAVGNFLGPLLLGRLFDTVGRRVMISSTYILAGSGPGGGRAAVPAQCGVGDAAHRRLVGDLLLRLGGSERRLPDRERGVSDGDAGDGDSLLLRLRDGHRRDHRAALYGHNIATGNRTTVYLGYLLGAGADGAGRHRRDLPGGQCRAGQLEDVAEPITAEATS